MDVLNQKALVGITMALVLIVVGWSYFYYSPATKPANPLKGKYETSCKTDADCFHVPLMECGSCDCGGFINVKEKEKYLDERMNLCKDYLGAVCDMTCTLTTPSCESGQCVGKQQTQNTP